MAAYRGEDLARTEAQIPSCRRTRTRGDAQVCVSITACPVFFAVWFPVVELRTSQSRYRSHRTPDKNWSRGASSAGINAGPLEVHRFRDAASYRHAPTNLVVAGALRLDRVDVQRFDECNLNIRRWKLDVLHLNLPCAGLKNCRSLTSLESRDGLNRLEPRSAEVTPKILKGFQCTNRVPAALDTLGHATYLATTGPATGAAAKGVKFLSRIGKRACDIQYTGHGLGIRHNNWASQGPAQCNTERKSPKPAPESVVAKVRTKPASTDARTKVVRLRRVCLAHDAMSRIDDEMSVLDPTVMLGDGWDGEVWCDQNRHGRSSQTDPVSHSWQLLERKKITKSMGFKWVV
ncbi:hypothetical protein C8R47DRAFT_1072038 [Mycena vitilis]|nr:hypothetical protein C8R47DRAFT_1072038 [Mycena vitilis]